MCKGKKGIQSGVEGRMQLEVVLKHVKLMQGQASRFHVFRVFQVELKHVFQVLYDYDDKINAAVYPGLQGGPHNHTITGFSRCTKTATTAEYKAYQEQVLNNCAKFVQGINGSRVEKVPEVVHIVANKNTVPSDVSAMVPGGIRMGTPALTSRGFLEEDCAKVADFFYVAVKLALKIKAETKGRSKLKDFVVTIKIDGIQSEITKLRHEVEEYAKAVPNNWL